jgi:hypothetical protein
MMKKLDIYGPLIFAVASVFGFTSFDGPAFAVEPKAALSGPAAAKVKSEFFLRLTGTVADKIYLIQAIGPVDSQIDLLYDSKSRPTYGVCSASRPGSYTFVAIAYGAPAAPADPQWSFAFWSVTITETDPTPPVPPIPPGPTPPPVPPPTPPVVGKLWAVLILPDAITRDQSHLRESPTLKAKMDAAKATFRSYQIGDAEVKDPKWQDAVKTAGGPPAMLWITENTEIVRITRQADEPAILIDLALTRGK